MGEGNGPAGGIRGGGDASDLRSDFEARMQLMASVAGGSAFECDPDGRYRSAWIGDPSVLVRAVPELVGRTIREVMGPAFGERFHALFRHVLETRSPGSVEYTLDRPHGRRVHSFRAMPLFGDDGAARSIVLFVKDVTEERNHQARLQQAERLAALGVLAATVGHEVRQPLAFMTNSVEALGRALAPEVGSEVRRSLDRVHDGLRRIKAITDGLKGIHPDASRVTKALDVRQPLLAALEIADSALAGATLEKDIGEVPTIDGSEGELCQVFLNLLLNAVQAMSKRSPLQNRLLVSTAIGERASDRKVVITVQDNGPGIRDDVKRRLFEPFFTSGKSEGTGLGLYVCARIVEAHGGKLEVESEVGKGCTMRILLPFSQDELSGPTTGVRALRPRPSSTRRSVLLVDDEPKVLDSLRVVVGEMHDVTVATRSGDALALLMGAPTRFDVIVCDLTMADLDGIALYEEAERLGIAPRFVVMTGGAFTHRARTFLARKACPSIDKPFLVDELLTLIGEVGDKVDAG